MFMATAYQGDKPYIFLSYAHIDRELAHSVIEYLQEKNFNVWFDEGIHTGTQWEDVIIDKIKNCWMMVFLVTKNSLASDWCRQELTFAKEKGKKFINVVINNPTFPDWFNFSYKRYQFLYEEKFPNRKAMLDKLNSELIWHQMNTDKPTDTAKETQKAKAPWVCKNCGSNNSGDDDVCEVCGSSDRYVAPKETPKPSPTEGLEFSIVDGTARVDRYKGTDTKVIIPAKITYNGKTYKVTAIGDGAFNACKNLTSISIPNSVTSIGELAFEFCTSLTSIVVDENNQNYKSIDGNLYSKDGTTLIQYAIGKTKTSFTIPDHVTTIEDLAFWWCKNITSIDVDKNNTHYKSIDGNLYSKDGTTLIQYAIGKTTTSFTIPNSITTIGVAAFVGCENLTSITIPNSVTSISESAFWGCENLTSISIPDSVTSISKSAFAHCFSLTSITIPNSVTTIGESAFSGCSSLTSITIPNNVTTIGNFAFSDCENLTSITIPDSVTFIGKSAFAWCENLTYVSIPYGVTTIDRYAFSWCSSLTSITIPKGVKSIGYWAFSGCTNLTIYCETKSKPEGWHADWNPDNSPVIWNCGSSSPKEDEVCGSSKPSTDSTTTPKPSHTEGLEFTITDGTATVTSYKGTDTKVIIPATITRDGKTYKVTAIGKEAFFECTSLASITIPNSVTSIGESAFEWCENLTSVSIPYSVTSIGINAFELCSSLTSIVVDENNQSYKSIDGNLYSRDGTILIKYAIGKTETSFTIPDHVTSIREDAFAYCENLTSITIPDGITTIGESAFEGCENLTSITIPNSVTTIGEMAFYDCTNLTSITIPDHVTTIGRYAFCNCTNLTSITIPNSVTTIGESAFEGCENLTSITIPDGVTSIGESAFSGCENLTSITIPNSVTSIGINAFEWCDKLTIYCEAKSKPRKWHADWNPDNRPVVWGYGSTERSDDPNPLELVSVKGLYFIIGDGTATVYSYLDIRTKVIIPDTITNNGKTYKVTAIGDWAFEDCFGIDEITIPNSVTSIGRDAFMCCESLTSIFIPNSVTSIGESAFYDCYNLAIYCEANSKPSDWHVDWNPSNCPVVWGYKLN